MDDEGDFNSDPLSPARGIVIAIAISIGIYVAIGAIGLMWVYGIL